MPDIETCLRDIEEAHPAHPDLRIPASRASLRDGIITFSLPANLKSEEQEAFLRSHGFYAVKQPWGGDPRLLATMRVFDMK